MIKVGKFMKLKAPKTWQLILIIVSAIVLAIGGSFLAVYLKTGFKPVNTPPGEIAIDDVDSVFNATNGQYEVVNGFRLKVTTPTENVNQDEITLSFPSGIYTTKTDDGKISDGIIKVKEKVKINEIINVELVKETYIGEKGECQINKGGISNLVFTTQNEELSSSQIQIAVDVPVVDIKIEAFNSTTGDKFSENENVVEIAQSTNFVLRPTFYPEASRYMFSDDKNSAAVEKREKRVYYNLDSANNGLSFNYNDGDVYFVAGSETSENNIIHAYSFASAAEQDMFDKSNAQLTGLSLYTEAIRVLSTSETAAKAQIKVNVVEANVGKFSIKSTEGAPLGITVDKLFKLSAGNSSFSDADLSISILDTQSHDLSAMIKNVGLRIVSVKKNGSEMTGELSSYVKVKGGATKTFNGKEYVLINSNVKNLKHANWEISTSGEYEIVAEVKLFVQNAQGETEVFEDEEERKVYLKSTEHKEEDVAWADGVAEKGISMTIVYDNEGNALPSQYSDLRSFASIPTDNVYQKIIFFAYYDATFDEGKDMGDYIAVVENGAGIYTIAGETNKKLYPLQGGYELIAKDAIDFKLLFATVRTDAYGNPIMTLNGTYYLVEISSPVSVSVKKTLQGFESVSIKDVSNEYLVEEENGYKYYAIPAGVEEAFTLEFQLKAAGDTAIFENEKKNIKIYSSADSNGGEDAGVFEFGKFVIVDETKGIVSVSVSVKAGVQINADRGIGYNIFIEYDNSVNVLKYTAAIEEGVSSAIKVYNQKPNSIENDALKGKTFNVSQTMENNGNSTISIVDEDGNPVTDLNAIISGTIVKDHYGREFAYDYSISSSDSKLVIADNKDHKITFGTGSGEATVTVKAGSDQFSFTIKANSTGVTKIEVDGNESDSLSNPKYTFAGKQGTSITLKNSNTEGTEKNGLLDVYVTNGIYNSSAYTLTIKNMPDEIHDVVKFNDSEDFITNDTEVTSFKLLDNFGKDVTLTFNASNSQGTLNFTFQITIQKYAVESLSDFGNVKYGEDTTTIPGQTIEQIGVANDDKGEDFDESETYVYAAFPIKLNDYLKVGLGSESESEAAKYIDWGERFKVEEGSEFILTDVNGIEIGTITNGVLTFYDVYVPTAYTFVLNANVKNSQYAYSKEITLVVCPNFKLVRTENEFSIASLQKSQDIGTYFAIKRITLGYSFNGSETNPLDIKKLETSGYKVSEFLKVENKQIQFTKAADFNYGEDSKSVTVSLLATIEEQTIEIATCDADLLLGYDVSSLSGYSSLFNPDNIVKYNNVNAVWFSGSSAELTNIDSSKNGGYCVDKLNTGEDHKVYVKVGQNSNFYNINADSINFKSSSKAIVAGENIYITLYFFNYVSSENDIATWKLPVVWSRIGDKVASYEYETEAEKDITHSTNNLEQNYFANVEGGKDYYLVAPFEYVIYRYSKDGSTKDRLILIAGSDETYTTDEGINGVEFSLDANFILKINGEYYSVGQAFEVGDKTYYYRSYSIDADEKVSVVLSQAYVGEDGTINAKWDSVGKEFKGLDEGEAGSKYTISEGLYGPMLTSLGDMNFLTGLQKNDFEENIASVTFGSLNGQKYYTIDGNILKLNDIICDEEIKSSFVINQFGSTNDVKLTYNFYLLITPNATSEGNVTYPFDGDFENLAIESGESVSIDIVADKLGGDTANSGKLRIADKITALEGMTLRNSDGNISEGATLKIKSLSIDGNDFVVNDTSAGNGAFYLSLNGTKVTLTNRAAAKNVNVVLVREYPNVYGADVEYQFTINSSNITYKIKATNPENFGSLTELNSEEWTWKLANTTDEQTLNITTKQQNDSGASSNVDTNSIITVMTNDLGTEYSVGYVYNDVVPKLSITIPGFVASETTKHVYFVVKGITIATINIVIPATVDAKQKQISLNAGANYDYADLVNLSGVDGSIITPDKIEIISEKNSGYVSVTDDTSIAIFNAIAEQEVTLKFNYTYKANADTEGQSGFVEFRYTIKPNLVFKSGLDSKRIVAETPFEIDFSELLSQGEPDAADFTLSTDGSTSLFKEIKLEDSKISVKANYVAQSTSTKVVLTISYKELFTKEIPVTFTIYPAVKLKTNYPNPGSAENNLTYESVVSGTGHNNFLTSAAEFASAARFQVSTAALNGGNVIYPDDDYAALSGNIDKIKVKEYNNMTSVNVGETNLLTDEMSAVAVDSTFTFIRGDESGTSYVVLQITYKGVVIEYTVYVFDKVVAGYTNGTTNTAINGSELIETIYTDRVDTTDLFNKNRLLQVEITSSAEVGSICYPYIINLDENGNFASTDTQLLAFKIESSYIGKSIFVDSGKDKVELGKNQAVWFLTQKVADDNQIPAVVPGVVFKRLAGRVEYNYATADGQSIRIDHKDLSIGIKESKTSNNVTTYTVGYKFGSDDYKSTITYKTTNGLDITVDRAYDATNSNATPTIIEIYAHVSESSNNAYSLREQVGLRHPSTGEYITAESMGDAVLNYEVVSFNGNSWKKSIYNYALNLNDRGYMSKTTNGGKDYLEFHDIASKIGETTKIYDYYILALGCAADGDYVLLKITYTLGTDSKDFYVAFKIVSDYVVTLGGKSYSPENGIVSNANEPYVFTPVETKIETTENGTTTSTTTYKEMLLATAGTGTQIISIVREKWDNVNIAYAFEYKIEQDCETGYNTSTTMSKLRLDGDSSWAKTEESEKVVYYKNTGNTISIQPAEVVFGTKSYMIEIRDIYDYVIKFYFDLVPDGDQTPAVYTAASTLSFTEGEDFDIGLVYDAIAVNEVQEQVTENDKPKTDDAGNPVMKKTGYTSEISYNQIPDSDAMKKIILQNIDAWGLTTPLPSDAELKESDAEEGSYVVSGLGDYADSPKFQNVTVTGVEFKYEDSRGSSSRSAVSQTAKQIKIGDIQYDIGSTITLGGISYKSQKSDDGIQLNSTINGTVETTVDKDNSVSYSWKATLYEDVNVDGTIVNDDGVFKIVYNGTHYSENDESSFIEIKNDDKIVTSYKFTGLDVENGKITISGTYCSFTDSENKNYWCLNNKDKQEFSLANKTDGNTLATDTLFWPGADGKYRTLQSGNYTVPVMDGWIYGTADQTSVSIIIDLTYKSGDVEESCVVVCNATISRKAKFLTSKKVVSDAVEFTLSDYIEVRSDGINKDKDAVFYDDTLAVTIPTSEQVVLSVNIKDNETKKWKNNILYKNNTSTTSQKTEYISLSSTYGKTLSPNDTIKISWYGSNGASVYYANEPVNMSEEGFILEKETQTLSVTSQEEAELKTGYSYHAIEVKSGAEDKTYKLVELNGEAVDNYAGSKVSLNGSVYTVNFDGDGLLSLTIAGGNSFVDTETEPRKFTQEITMKSITTDTLYIESIERLPDSTNKDYQYNITKSYIIGTNGTFYQYEHNYTMTPAYAFFNNGLGIAVTKEIAGAWEKGDNGYTVTLDQWASALSGVYDAVTVCAAKDSVAHQPEMGTPIALSGEDSDKLAFTIGTGVAGDSTEATIDSSGTVKTGASYDIHAEKPQYILIKIWIKVSGGPNGEFENNDNDSKRLLGELRIYLTDINMASTQNVKSGEEKSFNTFMSASQGWEIEEIYEGIVKIEVPGSGKIDFSIIAVNGAKENETYTINLANDSQDVITQEIDIYDYIKIIDEDCTKIWIDWTDYGEVDEGNEVDNRATINLDGTEYKAATTGWKYRRRLAITDSGHASTETISVVGEVGDTITKRYIVKLKNGDNFRYAWATCNFVIVE